MAINTKAIKARIGSVKNTKKISKAMQMIAAVKMRRAVQHAINTRPYALLSAELASSLSGKQLTHPLTEVRPVKSMLMVVITSNKGLCGSYNTYVLKAAQKFVDANQDKNISIVAIGSKSALFARRNSLKLEAFYEDINESTKINDIRSLSKFVCSSFVDKQFDHVELFYTNYISGLVQKVDSRKILPISKSDIENINAEIVTDKSELEIEKEDMDRREMSNTDLDEYKFEPLKDEVLESVMPMVIEIQIYQAILESAASEHSSRMVAMKNASDAATDMINSLTQEFNKGRQAAITQEVAEINAGADALN